VGTLTEMLGVEITDGADETILSIVGDPRSDGYIVQVDRYESGIFSAVDASQVRVMRRVPHSEHDDPNAPLPDNARPLPPARRFEP